MPTFPHCEMWAFLHFNINTFKHVLIMWSIKLPDYYDSKRIAKGISFDQLKTYMSKPDRSFMNGIYSDVDNVNGKLSDYSKDFQDWYNNNQFSTYWGDSDIPMLYNWWFNNQLDDNYKAEEYSDDDATLGSSSSGIKPFRLLMTNDGSIPQNGGVAQSSGTHSETTRPDTPSRPPMTNTDTPTSSSTESTSTRSATETDNSTRSSFLSDQADRLKNIAEEIANGQANGETSQTENVTSPQEQLTDLIDGVNEAIDNGYATLFGTDSQGSIFKSGSAILQLITAWSKLASTKDLGLSEANRVSLAQSVYNTVFQLVNQQITQDLALRNWYTQQDYNSPVNAIARLMEAGINPAYYYESMQKSAAGEISSGEAAHPSSAQFGDNMTNAQRRASTIAEALTGIGGTVQALLQGGFGGVTSGIKNLADSTAAIGNLKLQQNLQPYEIGQIQANTASTWAQKFLTDTENAYKPQLYKAQQYQLTEQAKNYSQAIDMMQKDLDNKLQICKLGNETQMYCSDNQCYASIISANLGAGATKYASDNNYEASVFGSRLSLAASVLPHVYTHQRVENLYDASTGKKIDLSADQQFKLKGAILRGELDFHEGAEFTWNGRKVVGMYMDTDVLDVMRLNGMNDFFNNFIETGHVMGKKPLDGAKMSGDASDYLMMYNHAKPYIDKGASAAITNAMMFKKQDYGLIRPGWFSGK